MINPIARNDLRLRLGSPKAITLITAFLALLALLMLLSLPPELGRLDELGRQGLLRALLVIELVLLTYFTSATASGEIGIDGEKSAWDLAASPFPSGMIARGKTLTSAAYAAVLAVLGSPLLLAVAGIRGDAPGAIGLAAIVAIPFATAMGAVGTLYGALLESDFTRSFIHWLTLLALLGGLTALPAPWDLSSPVRALLRAVDRGVDGPVAAAILGYLLLAALCGWATARRVDAIRREAAESA